MYLEYSMKKLWENKRDEKVNNEAQRQEKGKESTSLKRALVLPNLRLRNKVSDRNRTLLLQN